MRSREWPTSQPGSKWECPWEVVCESIAKDSPVRTAWGELPSVEQLMEAMSQTTEAAGGTADAEMEVTAGGDVRDEVMATVAERSPAQKRAPSTEGAGPAQKKQSEGAASASSQNRGAASSEKCAMGFAANSMNAIFLSSLPP